MIFELLWNIENNLHVTKKNMVEQNKNNTIDIERILIRKIYKIGMIPRLLKNSELISRKFRSAHV